MYEPGRSFVKSSSCVARVFDGETVLVPIGGAVADLGSIFVMNEVAAHVWSLIDGRMDVSGYIRAQMDRYDVGFDTAAVETPACFATSAIVTRRMASCDFIMPPVR